MTANCSNRVTSQAERINENDAAASVTLIGPNFEKQQNRVQQQAELALMNEGQIRQQELWANSRDSCDIYDQLE